MTLKAADLPDHIKRSLLDKLRDQLGSDTYDQMVDSMGEDGLLDLLLAQATESAATTQGPWRQAWGVVTATVGFLLATGWGWMVLWVNYSALGPKVGTAVLVVGLFVIFTSAAAYYESEKAQVGLGLAALAVVLAATGFGVWKVSGWLFEGVRQWWSWLGSHF